MRPNETKRLLGAGKPALGTFCLGGSPLIAETLGRAGYDFVIVDLQHSASTSGSLLGMLQAVSCTPATPIVRVSANQPADIQRALDLGAYGLVVPMVNTRAEAEAILAIRDAAAATGKAAGIYTPSATAAKARLAQGFRFVCIQSDFGMVMAAAADALRTVRS